MDRKRFVPHEIECSAGTGGLNNVNIYDNGIKYNCRKINMLLCRLKQSPTETITQPGPRLIPI